MQICELVIPIPSDHYWGLNGRLRHLCSWLRVRAAKWRSRPAGVRRPSRRTRCSRRRQTSRAQAPQRRPDLMPPRDTPTCRPPDRCFLLPTVLETILNFTATAGSEAAALHAALQVALQVLPNSCWILNSTAPRLLHGTPRCRPPPGASSFLLPASLRYLQ